MRHGVALSLKRGASINEIDEAMLERVARVNDYLENHEDEFSSFVMYDAHDDTDKWSGYRAVEPIAPETVTLGAFVFIGRLRKPDEVSVSLILRDFDRLLPLSEFAEGGEERTLTEEETGARVFVPGLKQKPSVGSMNVPARRVVSCGRCAPHRRETEPAHGPLGVACPAFETPGANSGRRCGRHPCNPAAA